MAAAVGIAFEFALRIPANFTRSAGIAAATATAVLLVWGNLAVGFAGSENNRINIIFFAAPLLALIGSMIASCRCSGTACALRLAAVTQVTAGIIALLSGHFTIPLTASCTGF
jgi:hypothetical protein